MDELLTRIWENVVGRLSGPMTFRFILQPTMATIFAIRDGLKDARADRPAYFYSVLTDSTHRRDLLREGWKAVARVFVLGIIMDAIYQFIVLRWFYPFEALLVAFTLAFLPYLLIRGPVNRIARLWGRRHTRPASEPRQPPLREVRPPERRG